MQANSTATFKIQTASIQDVLRHLTHCDRNFVPPLSATLDIESYAAKIVTNAKTFEAWNDENLIGLIAAYYNDLETREGFITNVSTYIEYQGLGIAASLMKMCIEHGIKNEFKKLSLQVHVENKSAINLYRKFDFEVQKQNNDKLIMSLALTNNNHQQ